MAQVIDALDDRMVEWIQAQPVFFVASAPSSGGHVNVSPKGHDSLRVLGPRSVDYDAALTEFPELVEHLAGARAAGSVRGAGPLRQRSVRRTIGNVRLVGDASGYVDALTGEGLRIGFAQAAAAIAHLDDPAGYERAWAHVTRDYWLLTTGLLAFIAAWNEFLYALSFTQTPEHFTVTLAIFRFAPDTPGGFQIAWGEIMAATIIITIPLVVLTLIFQRRIVAGLTAGAVKG